MSLPCPVQTCRRDMAGSQSICGACESDLRRALADVPWLARELDVTLAKQHTRAGTGSGEVEDDPTPAVLHIGPLGMDPRASKAAHALRNALVGWVRVMSEGWTAPHGPACRSCAHDSCITATGFRDTLPSMARWLSAMLSRLVRHSAAPEAHGEIVDAVRDAEGVVDLPTGTVFAGACGQCGASLFADIGASTVDCRTYGCDSRYDVKTRRDALMSGLLDHLATAAQAAHILTQLTAPCTPELVRKWAERERIIPHGRDLHDRPLYRVGDVLEMLLEKLERDAERKAKRERREHERMAS